MKQNCTSSTITQNSRLETSDIVYITGESGFGKSVLLRALERTWETKLFNIDSLTVDPDKPLIEMVGKDLNEGLELSSRVGLNDVTRFSGNTVRSATVRDTVTGLLR